MPLWFGMVPEDVKGTVINHLVGDIVARQEGHLNTAVIGTQALFEELPRLGKADLAYEIAMQKTYPGYLWPLLHFGLTSLPEHWEGGGTHEHPFFGSVGAFFYKWLGGIQPDDLAPGFKHFWIRPSIDNPLEFVNSSYRSIRGLIRSEWRKSGSALSLEVEVPANATADVEIPKFGYAAPQIEEGGQVIWSEGKPVERTDILAATDLPEAVRFRVSGGTYQFRVDSQEPLAAAQERGNRSPRSGCCGLSGRIGRDLACKRGEFERGEADSGIKEWRADTWACSHLARRRGRSRWLQMPLIPCGRPNP